MTLATHMATGAAISGLFATSPAQAFLIGWLSHYIFDTIAHWDYPIDSYASEKSAPTESKVIFNRATVFDIAKVLADVLLGVFIVTAFYYRAADHSFLVFAAGAIGATIPDFIQFLYGSTKLKVLEFLQRFHHFMHSGKSLNGRPVIGIGLQLSLILFTGIFIELFL